jgi:uncharacterized protein (DUF1697 family)
VTRYIALLRGVNVGGNKIVSMADLRALLAKVGFTDVQTLLQSGNVVFSGPSKAPSTLESQIEKELEKRLELNVDVHIRTPPEWRALIDGNPFPAEAKSDPARLLLTCYRSPLEASRVRAAREAITGPERLHASGRHLYMTYPNGMGNSKAALVVGKTLGAGTARNWNTVLKLAAML